MKSILVRWLDHSRGSEITLHETLSMDKIDCIMSIDSCGEAEDCLYRFLPKGKIPSDTEIKESIEDYGFYDPEDEKVQEDFKNLWHSLDSKIHLV